MSGFDFNHFKEFLDSLSVSTKELGVVTLGQHLLGGQRRLLSEFQRGFEEGVREFVVLKCRQMGCSTFSLAWDLYWLFQHGGTPGALVVHEDRAREQFRAIIEQYYAGLPVVWKRDIVQHNRHQLLFDNRSMLQYMVAGVKETSAGTLGKSSAISFGHFTEVAAWGDEEQIPSLKATMAEQNPLRFFLWESTANGFNHYYRMWEDARQSITVRGVFVTWWSHDFYRVARDSPLWRRFWGKTGRPDQQEKLWLQRVEREYGHELTDEQLAWYRWKRETIGDEMALMENYPTLPDDAFVATGSKFFTAQALTENYKRVLQEPAPKAYRIHIGAEFTDTTLADVAERLGHLRVWEEPVEGAYYAIGADPAYGASENSDRFAINVLRCYANRVEQVAEYCRVDIAPYTFAWVIVYLAGCYRPCVYNLELNGPGGAVLQEIDNLRKMASRALVPGVSKTMRDVVGRMQDFLYVQSGTLYGKPTGVHTLTTERVKDIYMGGMKDAFERGIFVPHSRYLLDEMKNVIRDGARIDASGDTMWDRVVATALAIKGWNDQLRSRLINQNVVWVPPEERTQEAGSPDSPLGRRLRSYLLDIGYLQKPKVDTGVRAYNLPTKTVQ